MNRSLTSIVGFGIAAAIFLALLSAFYLEQIPNRGDMERLAADLAAEHGRFLDPAVPVDVELVLPAKEGDPMGVRIRCAFRVDVRKRPETVDLQLERLAEAALQHPDWRGRVSFADAIHTPEPRRECRVAGRMATAQLGDGRTKG